MFLDFKKWVKSIQTAGYNGARTVVFTSFHLEFSSFWISRSFDLGDLGVLRMGPVNVFKNYIFEIRGSS